MAEEKLSRADGEKSAARWQSATRREEAPTREKMKHRKLLCAACIALAVIGAAGYATVSKWLRKGISKEKLENISNAMIRPEGATLGDIQLIMQRPPDGVIIRDFRENTVWVQGGFMLSVELDGSGKVSSVGYEGPAEEETFSEWLKRCFHLPWW